MAWNRAGIVLMSCTLAACAGAGPTVRPQTLSYEPPVAIADSPPPVVVERPLDAAWNDLMVALAQSALRVVHADPDEGIVVATYRGTPEPFLECGMIQVSDGGEMERIPGARSEVQLNRIVGGTARPVRRNLRLDTRVVFTLQPLGADETEVSSDATYVLTKTVEVVGGPGSERARGYEVVTFSGDERAAFEKGTLCFPTGAVETTVAQALRLAASRRAEARPRPSPPEVDIAPLADPTPAPLPAPPAEDLAEAPAADPGPDWVEPGTTAEAEIRFDCEGRGEATCALLALTDPYDAGAGDPGTGVEVDVISGPEGFMNDAGLRLDINLPAYQSYLMVSYVSPEGVVEHLREDQYQPWPANARELLNRQGDGAGTEEGIAMVMAVASEQPLFREPRPLAETAEEYLAALRASLAELEATSPDARVSADHVFLPEGPASGA